MDKEYEQYETWEAEQEWRASESAKAIAEAQEFEDYTLEDAEYDQKRKTGKPN